MTNLKKLLKLIVKNNDGVSDTNRNISFNKKDMILTLSVRLSVRSMEKGPYDMHLCIHRLTLKMSPKTGEVLTSSVLGEENCSVKREQVIYDGTEIEKTFQQSFLFYDIDPQLRVELRKVARDYLDRLSRLHRLSRLLDIDNIW